MGSARPRLGRPGLQRDKLMPADKQWVLPIAALTVHRTKKQV